MTEEHVAARQDHAAIFHRREIDLTANLFQAIPVRQGFAINAQPRDAAVRKDLETKVGPSLIAGNSEWVQRIAIQIRLRQDLSPRDRFSSQLFGSRKAAN